MADPSGPTLVRLFERLLARPREEAFLSGPGEWRSVGASVDFARALGAELRSAGVGPRDRIVLHLPHGPAQAMAVFAVALAGGVVVLANPRSKAPQLRALVEDCDPHCVVSHESLRSVIDPEAAFAAVDTIWLDWPANGCLEIGGRPLVTPSDFEPATVRPDDLAILLYTSGSTGRPKGVMQSHRSLVDGARIVSGYLGLRPEDQLYGLLPLSFDYGLNQLLGAVFAGASLHLRPFLNGQDLHHAVVDSKVSVLAGVPEVHLALVDAMVEAGADGVLLRILTNSGGVFPERALHGYQRFLPRAEIFSMYGLTEAFRSSFVPPAELARRVATVGRAMPEVELLVVGEESGRPLPAGRPGELVHCGVCVAQGYWRRPEETRQRFRKDPRGGDAVCVFSGDLATIDEDGFVTLHGRRDAQLKIHGQRVSPDEVTEVVRRVTGVNSAAAVGVPRGKDLQTVLCVAVTVDSDTDLEDVPRAVRAACRRELPPHMVPAEVHVLDQLPLTGNHKVDHVQLRSTLGATPPPDQRGR